MSGATVLIPAHDEAGYIGACLAAVTASCTGAHDLQVIVIANGCSDDTAAIARRAGVEVIETAQGGKLPALELGDGAARHGTRIYLDADVVVSPDLLHQLIEALSGPAPRYASGRPVVARAQSALTRAYARFWQGQPFLTQGVPGFGIFAVNAAGRARWGAWPDIISDDTFVRLQFSPSERVRVPASYTWPMVEGAARLVRVRRRQDRGVAEIRQRFPLLMQNEDPRSPSRLFARALRDPSGFAVYAAISLAVRILPGAGGWERGR